MSESNGYATRAAVLDTAFKRRYADSRHYEGFGKFRMRSLTTLEAGEIGGKILIAETPEERIAETLLTNARWVAAVCVDAEGALLFTEEDVKRLAKRDAQFVCSLARECQKHVGADVDVGRAEKNSDATDG